MDFTVYSNRETFFKSYEFRRVVWRCEKSLRFFKIFLNAQDRILLETGHEERVALRQTVNKSYAFLKNPAAFRDGSLDFLIFLSGFWSSRSLKRLKTFGGLDQFPQNSRFFRRVTGVGYDV